MNTVSKPNKIRDWGDIAVTAISLLLGLFFLYHSFSIDESLSGDGVGQRLVPQIIATLLIVFSVSLLTTSLRGQSEQPPHHSASEALEDVADEIRALLERQGLNLSKGIVVYCQTHHRSAHTYIALKSIGLTQIKGYPGAWSEWGNAVGVPIER